jgi:type IV pilus assembly protein PilE
MTVIAGRWTSVRRPSPCRAAGFTLVELMVAVAVLAIIASVAIPSYKSYVIRGKLTQAFGSLSSWAVGMQQVYQDDRSYTNGCGTTGAGAAPSVNAGEFTYDCPTKSATAFTLRARGNSGTSVNGFTFTIDQGGARATSATPSGLGFPTSTSCWVISSSGACY